VLDEPYADFTRDQPSTYEDFIISHLSVYNQPMLEFLMKTLVRECDLKQGQQVLVGVSGGADSICLLDLLHQLGYSPIAAHFNHGIRSNACVDAEKVQAMCEEMEISMVGGKGNVPLYAQKHGLPIEEVGRILRYQFLFKQAKEQKSQAVAVAHHADDQVETVLMHILRGSGLDGLAGMSFRMVPNPWSDSIPLIRPLLGVWKDEIDAYCEIRGLTPIQDISNLDTKFFRNRVRHHLIPQLDAMVPGVRRRLWQITDLIKADLDVIQTSVDQAWSNVVSYQAPDLIAFQRYGFIQLSLGLQRRLIKRAVAKLRLDPRDIDYALVKRVLDFIAKPTRSSQADIGLGLRIALEDDLYILASWDTEDVTGLWPQVSEDEWVKIPGMIELDQSWLLQTDYFTDIDSAQHDARGNQDPFQAWIDIGENPTGLSIRKRRQGERFQPFGMRGKGMKLSDFMINARMPKSARARWPLVCLRDEIVWVPGYRLADPYQLTSETTRVVHLRLTRNDVGQVVPGVKHMEHDRSDL